MIENLLGLGVLIFGSYLYNSSVSALDYTKAIGAIIGAIIYLGYVNYEPIMSYFKRKVTVNPEQIFRPQEFELYDTNCLIHLRNRCIENNSEEGVETCAKLNSIMFGFKSVSKKEDSDV